MFGGRRLQSPQYKSGALYLRREGKVGHSLPAAGLIIGAAHTSLRAAIRHLGGMMA